MYKDYAAIHHLSGEIRGRSIHRRGLSGPNGRFTDLHVRVPTKLIQGELFSPQYCQMLGEELSGLDVKLYQSYLTTLYGSVGEPTIVGAGNTVRENQIYLATPDEDGRLFEVLRNTLLSVVINNYMSKFMLIHHKLFMI